MEAAQVPPIEKTMILTGVGQIVAPIGADYLAEKIAEFYDAGGHGVIEICDRTYVNPIHIITFGVAEDAPEKPGIVKATAMPPGMGRG